MTSKKKGFHLFRRNKDNQSKPSATELLQKALVEKSPTSAAAESKNGGTQISASSLIQAPPPSTVSTFNKTTSTKKISSSSAAAAAATSSSAVLASTKKSKSSPSSLQSPSPSSSSSSSWLCRTSFFQKMVETSFELVDQDGSGTIDEKELYSGLLLIHLKLGTYAGPAACKPISREKCHAVFLKMDADKSGYLDREEFTSVMMVLFGNVMMRVAIQYACTLLIVPLIAQYILNGILWMIGYMYYIISTMDERNEWANTIELTLEHIWTTAVKFWTPKIPNFIFSGWDMLENSISAIPESVWNTIPLTLISAVLSLMLIPWSLLKIDDVFQWLAERNRKDDGVSATETNGKVKKF